MKQLDLFGALLRRAKQISRPTVKKPAAPGHIEIDLDGRMVRVELHRRKSARHYTLSLSRDGTAVRLSLPLRASLASGLAFVQEKKTLVRKWLEEAPAPTALCPGSLIALHGVPHQIVWQADLPRTVFVEENIINVGGPENLARARVLRWLKAEALADLSRLTREIAAAHDIAVTKISVNNAAARWGSCSSDGSINFTWRLILVPPAARHYVVCHELAHRRHMNHSPAFWREVLRLGGDLSQRAWFKTRAARDALRAG